MSWKQAFLCSLLFVNILAQLYEDQRCRCICPTTNSMNGTQMSLRTMYIAYVPPSQCNCHGVILPKVSHEVRLNAAMFCPRCECKYETRNTTIIMVVVIFVVWAVLLLTGYYLFLILLELLVSKKPNNSETGTRSDETENLLTDSDNEEMDEF